MIWCRFQKDAAVSYGIVEGDTVIAVEGDPFSAHTRTASKYPPVSYTHLTLPTNREV